jgi:hypothetical protein
MILALSPTSSKFFKMKFRRLKYLGYEMKGQSHKKYTLNMKARLASWLITISCRDLDVNGAVLEERVTPNH